MDLNPGQIIEIWRGWSTPTDEKIFSGYIEKYEPDGGLIRIVAKDKFWDLIRKEITHVYDSTIDASAGKISEIFKDIVTTYGGLTADAGSIQDSGTAITIGKFVCNHTDLFERCTALATALGWQFYYRADTDKVYFEPVGYPVNANTLTVGNNIVKVPKWSYDNTEMVNDLTVVGAYSEVETTESGRIGTTTGYNTTDVQLSAIPISVKVYNDNSNPPTTLKIGGVPNSTTTFDYYVDFNQKKIYPAPSTTFANNSYVETRYSLAAPIPIHQTNDASITAYGQFKKTITFTDIKTIADAEARGQNYLLKYSTPFVYGTIQVKSLSTNGLRAGQTVTVVDNVSTPTLNEPLAINRHTIRYPADFEECEVGDKMWRLSEWQADIQTALKRIAEDQLQNQDIVTELITADNSINSPIKVRPRYRMIKTQNASGDGIIWGNPAFAIWGTNKWTDGTGVLSAEANYWVGQFEDTYLETFYDTDFKDASTTSTWVSTGAVFTNGQIAVSTSIDYNNGTITSATLTANTSTNLTFYLSADGGNHWESTTSGAVHTFSNTGTDLRWKATASGNVTLASISIGGYH